MKPNPEYDAWQAVKAGKEAPAPLPKDRQPLAIISSMDDVINASELSKMNRKGSMKLSGETIKIMEQMQDEEFGVTFGNSASNFDGSALLDGLTQFFAKFEVPVGLINKLMELQKYHLKFIVDDSGSMNANTDSMLSEASKHVVQDMDGAHSKPMSRWQEAETRLHNMIDILAYVPTKSIEIRFMNASNVIYLSRYGKTVKEFSEEAHKLIHNNFVAIEVKYRTPTLQAMRESFQIATSHAPDPSMHYLLTDGVPTDATVKEIADLITNRYNPEGNPVTFLSCTDDDAETEWMKIVEEVAPFCAELDDFEDEKTEVLKDQGAAFPYTRGYWLISQLVAAINPDDLDAIDESLPFTKHTLDGMLGRVHSVEEYLYYFERNPRAATYMDLYDRFLNETAVARDIVPKEEQTKREKKRFRYMIICIISGVILIGILIVVVVLLTAL